MDSKKSINPLKIKQRICHFIIYETIIFFWHFLNNFLALLLRKIFTF